MEIDLRSIVLYLAQKGYSPNDIQKDINETFGPNKISYSTITKYLRLNRFSLIKSPLQKKAKFSNNEKNQILVKHSLKLFPFSSVPEIARMTHIPKSTVFDILTKQLHYVQSI